jgi:hypothetical protein
VETCCASEASAVRARSKTSALSLASKRVKPGTLTLQQPLLACNHIVLTLALDTHALTCLFEILGLPSELVARQH